MTHDALSEISQAALIPWTLQAKPAILAKRTIGFIGFKVYRAYNFMLRAEGFRV